MAAGMFLFAKRSKVTIVTENNEGAINNQQAGQQLVKANATNLVLNISGRTSAVGEEDYFKKIIDPKTGQCAIVGLDRRTITLKDKNGNVIWTVNLANEGDKVGLPVGNVDGDDVKFLEKSPVLYVSTGRASFDLDVHTGKVLGGAMH
jgi:hypothetical protein